MQITLNKNQLSIDKTIWNMKPVFCIILMICAFGSSAQETIPETEETEIIMEELPVMEEFHNPVIYSDKATEVQRIGENKLIKKGHYYGLYSKDNKVLVPAEYDRLMPNYSNEYLDATKGYKMGVIDLTTYQLVVPCEYDRVAKVNFNGQFFYQTRDGKKVYWLDTDGNQVFEKPYKNILMSGPYVYRVNEGDISILDKELNILYKSNEFSSITPLRNPRGWIVHKSKSGGSKVLDENFETIIPLIENVHISKRHPDYYDIISLENRKHGLLNSKGEEVLPSKFVRISVHKIGNKALFQVCVDAKENIYHIYNESGKKLLKNDYTTIHFIQVDGEYKYLSVRKDGVWGIRDLEDRAIIKNQFDNIGISMYPHEAALAAKFSEEELKSFLAIGTKDNVNFALFNDGRSVKF